MAEIWDGGGGEAEAPEANAGSELDPVVAALAAVATKNGEPLDRRLAAYIEEQTDQLREQRALKLRHLQSQSREGKLRRFGLRLRNGVQVIITLIFALIGLGLLIMIADALRSRSVVVESFDTPPALADRGLSGKVVASGLLDALAGMQARVRTSEAARTLANSWTGDIKIEVPETGISIGEIDRLLKARLGNDLHIEGDLVQTDTGGLALTVRGEKMEPKTFTGAAGDLDKLTVQAAEYVFGQLQPALYGAYLIGAGRDADAVAFASKAYLRTDEAERPFLLNIWGTALQDISGNTRDPEALYKEAIRLKPDYWIAYGNLMNSDLVSGDEEGAWRAGEQMRDKAGGRPGQAPEYDYGNADLLNWNLLAWRNSEVEDAKAHGGFGSQFSGAAETFSDIDIRLHDLADAAFQLQAMQGDASDSYAAAMAPFVRGRLAAEAGDTAKAAQEMEAFQSAYANPVVSTNYPGYLCWAAPVEEAAGHSDKADAVLKAAGHYVDCYRFRADILDHRGDWAAAQKAYASAVAIAPDLPAGYYSWGLALGRHGDLSGAVVKLSAANQRGPGWADPLKAWGDVLARQNRWSEALAKYDEALKRAPAWAELKQAREAAARHGS